jgi:hypothetical protein
MPDPLKGSISETVSQGPDMNPGVDPSSDLPAQVGPELPDAPASDLNMAGNIDANFSDNPPDQVTAPCPASSSVGAPGFGESLIPVWGSGRQAINDFQTGHPILGMVNAAFAITDVFLLKSIVTAAGKVIVKVAVEQASKEAAEKIAARAALRAKLLEELAQNGVKHTPENVIAIGKAADGRVVFLESGNSKAGLQHILERHSADFEAKGISEAQVPEALMKATTEGKVVGTVGSGKNARPIYEFEHLGKTQRVTVGVGDNGYIVTAHPVQ